MNSFLLLCALLTLLTVTSAARADHRFICTDSYTGKVCVVSADGKIEWERACKHPQDCRRLPNGNYLFCHSGGALEITPDKKTVWEYKAPAKTEVQACQPLPDGRVLVLECGTSHGERSVKLRIVVAFLPGTSGIAAGQSIWFERRSATGHTLAINAGQQAMLGRDRPPCSGL